jgi:hypothetical protein
MYACTYNGKTLQVPLQERKEKKMMIGECMYVCMFICMTRVEIHVMLKHLLPCCNEGRSNSNSSSSK